MKRRKTAPAPDRRRSTLRRQVNEAFCDPDGRLSIAKTIAVFAQIAVLYQMGRTWDTLIERDGTVLLIVLAFLIVPDALKKFIAMKYSGAAPTK